MRSLAGIATLPGLPSTALPSGLSPDGLPVGVQIVGPWLEDRTPLKLAELIERMRISPRALLRRKGTPYEELGLDNPQLTDDELIDLMIATPPLDPKETVADRE